VTDSEQRSSFFRQSGWLMLANIGGGALTWAVHFLSKAIPEGDYGTFGVFLAVVAVLPTLPLQMILAQQTAKALATGKRGELAGIIRLSFVCVAGLWLLASALVLANQQAILSRWKVADPMGLYLTLPVVLLSVLNPMFSGVLQGQQNFLWFGWGMILNGAGRLGVAAFAVLVLRASAPGMVLGILSGQLAAFAVAVWQSRSAWMARPEPYDRSGLFRQIAPLTLGFLGFQFLFSADTLFIKSWFPESDAGFYVAAGTLSRALMWVVLPLAAVMFPRLVASAAKSEKNNLFSLVLAGTGILAIAGAIALCLVSPLLVRFIFKPSYLEVATRILPWYAAAMVPLALANVLLNHLLARPESKWGLAASILAVALGYVATLNAFHASLTQVLQVVVVFNTLLLGVCAGFAWRLKAANGPA
jgi:O-antigen/teichoic acid export membrane protein